MKTHDNPERICLVSRSEVRVLANEITEQIID